MICKELVMETLEINSYKLNGVIAKIRQAN